VVFFGIPLGQVTKLAHITFKVLCICTDYISVSWHSKLMTHALSYLAEIHSRPYPRYYIDIVIKL